MAQSDYLQKSRAYKGFHYSEIEPEMLDYLHKRTVEMFQEVAHILDKHEIRYMLVGGTLLGAVTLHKFIPWDDDLDICVFDEDYEKMTECLVSELPDGMMFQCEKTEPNYYLDWGKVRDQHSSVYPDIPAYKENGVWIDIYPLKKIKENEVSYRIAKANFDYLNRRFTRGGVSQEEYLKRLKDGQLKEKVEIEKQKIAPDQSTSDVYVIWSASKKVIRTEWVEPLTQYDFEGLRVWSINNADAYLRVHYGDSYMEFPDDELRRVGITKVYY